MLPRRLPTRLADVVLIGKEGDIPSEAPGGHISQSFDWRSPAGGRQRSRPESKSFGVSVRCDMCEIGACVRRTEGATDRLGTLMGFLGNIGAGGTNVRPTPSLERPLRSERPSSEPNDRVRRRPGAAGAGPRTSARDLECGQAPTKCGALRERGGLGDRPREGPILRWHLVAS